MFKRVLAAAALFCAAAAFAEGEPKVSVLDWSESLDIEDYQSNTVSLVNARMIDSLVGGVIAEHDASYNNWRMELTASFDRAIAANAVTLYGMISPTDVNVSNVWEAIAVKTGEPVAYVWKPIAVPKLSANQGLDLIAKMLTYGSATFNVRYSNDPVVTPLDESSGPYSISFTALVQRFCCGIKYTDKEYMGTTCTIKVVLIDDSTSEKITLATFSHKYTDGKYEDGSGKWFDTRCGWFEKLPRDYNKTIGCTITNVEDCLVVKKFGVLETEEVTEVDIDNKSVSLRPVWTKEYTVRLEGGKSLIVEPFSNMVDNAATTTSNACYKSLAACFFCDDNGTTNFCGLVKQGSTNNFVRLVPTKPVDLSDEVEIKVVVRKTKRDSHVSYRVNGVYYTHNGDVNIPTVFYKVEDIVELNGCGKILDLHGDIVHEGSSILPR